MILKNRFFLLRILPIWKAKYPGQDDNGLYYKAPRSPSQECAKATKLAIKAKVALPRDEYLSSIFRKPAKKIGLGRL